jgi:hypothetical protein
MLALALFIAVLSLTQGGVANSQTRTAKKSSVASMTRYEKRLAATIDATRKRHGLCTCPG